MPFTPQNFVDKVGPAIKSSWLNALDVTANFVLGGAQTVAAALTALGLPSGGIPTPMTIALGGTSSVTGLNVVFTGTDSGAVNAYVISAPGLPALTNRLLVQFTPLHTNTGAATINTVAVVNQQGVALTGGELSSLGPVVVEYVSAMPAWQIVSTAGAQPGFSITPAEAAAGVTPVNFGYAPGNVLRYGGDPTGVASSLIAFTSAYNVAIATLPNHGSIYIPTGKYLIPSPGLNWTTALDLHMSGDGAEQSLLVGDATGGYTILTMNAGGPGTNGVYLNLSKFGVQNNNASIEEHGLALSDYLYASLTDMKIFASGNALVMKGMANYTVTNLNCLSWENNTAGNAALVLGPDSASVNCGPGHFIGCQFEGVGAVTTGGAVSSSGTYSTTFSGCAFNANGSALVSVVEAASLDDLTFLECYSESCANTTANTADLFYLGRTLAPINITIIGGTFNSGIGGKFCNYGILGNNLGSLTLINTQWNNFVTAAVNFGFSAPTRVIAFNNISAGSGSPPMFQQAAALGGAVHFWFAPALTSGWGVPTGNTPVAGFPGATATLIQCGVAIAQIITDLKTMGIYSS